MTPSLCLLGTDTAVGKTTVALALLHLARLRHLRLVPFKPVETGCAPTPADAVRLLEATGRRDLTIADVCPYPLPVPVAPSVAARAAGLSLTASDLLARANALASSADALLIESAGGLLSPYGSGLTSLSLANLFASDVLLVSANRLGTINHTALALAELRRTRVHLAGVILVDVTEEATPDRPHNAAEIHALTGTAPLGTLRFCPSPTPSTLAAALAADVDLSPIFGGALAPVQTLPAPR